MVARLASDDGFLEGMITSSHAVSGMVVIDRIMFGPAAGAPTKKLLLFRIQYVMNLITLQLLSSLCRKYVHFKRDLTGANRQNILPKYCLILTKLAQLPLNGVQVSITAPNYAKMGAIFSATHLR